jgi:K+-transporting ATPase ATPase B chain
LFDPEILRRAIRDSFLKLNPRALLKNPVIFVVEVGAAITTIFLIRDIVIGSSGIGFPIQIALWPWFTVFFANFAEAMAEARGKAQADTLRKAKAETMAKRVIDGGRIETVQRPNFAPAARVMKRATSSLATVAIHGTPRLTNRHTGESAPVIRESGGDRSAVTGGTKVLSIRLKSGSRPIPARRSLNA